MGMGDRIKQKAEELAGKAKKKTGDALDDEGMQAEGAAKEKKAQVKQTGDKAKDVFKK
jgi:uncharacterized protein YjbJ (UPF0337 family)